MKINVDIKKFSIFTKVLVNLPKSAYEKTTNKNYNTRYPITPIYSNQIYDYVM